MSDSQPPPKDSFEERLSQVYIHHQNGRHAEAESIYRELIAEEPEIWQLHFNLGLLFFEQLRYEEALTCYLDGLAINEDCFDLLYNTAICQKELERFEDAITSYTKALSLEPEDIDCRYNLAGCYRSAGKDQEAITAYTELLDCQPVHIPSLNNLAYLFHKSGNSTNARDLYQRILKLNPDHVFAEHMLAAINGDSRSAAPDSYIRDVFDQFAGHYEISLKSNLHYRLPSQLYDFYTGNVEYRSVVTLLDLGCGTGLVGEQFVDICRSMTGVDLSEKMVAVAYKKKIYESLVVAEILTFLKQDQTQPYDLVISADVFPYVGDLEYLFRAIGDRTSCGGHFLFSVEHLDSDCSHPQLQKSGRFSHSHPYITRIAADSGWKIIAEEVTNLRKERSEWIKGCIYGLARARINGSVR